MVPQVPLVFLLSAVIGSWSLDARAGLPPAPGSWDPLIQFGGNGLDPIVAVHLIHLHTGKVLVLDYGVDEPYGSPFSRLWTPPSIDDPGGTGTFEAVPNNHTNLFCSGHSHLADGRVLTAGGSWLPATSDPTVAPLTADLFDPLLPVGLQWNNPAAPPDMRHRRWYPTCTTLTDGSVFVVAGEISPGKLDTVRPERYTPGPGGGSWVELPKSAEHYFPIYALNFLAPGGLVFNAGGHSDTWIIDPDAPSPEWLPMGFNAGHPEYDHCGTVMYAPGKVLKLGGGIGKPPLACRTVSMIDLNQASPEWVLRRPMTHERQNLNATVLPDGTVLVTGGNRDYNAKGQTLEPVMSAELYDPDTDTWTLMPNMSHPRMYHSTALLLRDGRVVAAGGDDYPTAQIFRPPYLNTGVERPVIQVSPESMTYGGTCTIAYTPVEITIDRVALLRLGAVTHGFDQDQRRVPLTIGAAAAGTVTVLAPAGPDIAPPGHSMLFLLEPSGVPSAAAYVRVGGP